MSRRRPSTVVPEGVHRPRVLLTEPDPYLAFLVRVDLPEAEVIESGPGESVQMLLDARPDVVVIDLSGPRAQEFLAASGSSRLIGIVDGHQAARTAPPPAMDHLLLRPFRPGELYRALRESLGIRPRGRASRLERVTGALAPARLASVVLAAGIQLVIDTGRPAAATTALLVLALAYSVSRAAVRRETLATAWLDAGVTTLLLALTGGVESIFLPLGLVASAELGLVLGMRRGAVAAAAVAACSMLPAIATVSVDTTNPGQLFSWLALFPLVAVTTALAARMWRADDRDVRVLMQANRALGTLHRLARSVPGGLDVGGVADVALDQARNVLGAPAAVVLVGETELLGCAGSYGLPPSARPLVNRDSARLSRVPGGGADVVRRDRMPDELAAGLGEHPCWLAAPLRYGGVTLGMLLVACPAHADHELNRLFVGRLADETALGVENARIFDNVRRLSVDEERRRLARELHDGMAQALTHVRLELDFLARHGAATPDQIRDEAARLGRVVERAVDEVRSTIVGLRSVTNGKGLAGALRSYLNDLRGLGGPEITYLASGSVDLSADTEQEAFRIVQEAVSNSLRHSKASRVSVSLEADGTGVNVEVADDGTGLGEGVRPGGLGLRAMRERARAIGATLCISGADGGGTRVQLWLQGTDLALRPLEEVEAV